MGNSIQNFNEELNQSGIVSQRYEEWKTYRKMISQFMEKHLEVCGDIQRLMVIGAGGCDDIDLQLLKSYSKTLIISDIDDQSMKKGLVKQKMTDLELKQLDYLGLDGLGILEELEEAIGNDEGNNRVTLLVKRIETHLLSHQKKFVFGELVDVMICMPIYTQLLMVQMNHIMTKKYNDGKIKEEELFVLQRIVLDFMPMVIETLNLLMIKSLKDQGTLLVFSDILEDTVGGPYDIAFQEGGDFDQLVDHYNEKFGMGLGSYGLYHLETQLRQVDQYWFKWPFDSNRVLFVKGIVFRR